MAAAAPIAAAVPPAILEAALQGGMAVLRGSAPSAASAAIALDRLRRLREHSAGLNEAFATFEGVGDDGVVSGFSTSANPSDTDTLSQVRGICATAVSHLAPGLVPGAVIDDGHLRTVNARAIHIGIVR